MRVACGQIQAFKLEEAGSSLEAVEKMVNQAGDADADLLVLPECAYPAYVIRSVDAFRSSNLISPQDYLILLGRLARKRGLHIVSGFIEDMGTHLHNSAALIDDRGQVVGCYRKSFLWAADNDYFRPGERVDTFATRLGQIGMVICADTRAPEIIAKLQMGGAELIAMPTCWVNVADSPGHYENPQPEFLIPARAREFQVPFVCANKFGMETETLGYCGRSMITDHTGQILQEAPGDGEVLIVADIAPHHQASPKSTQLAWNDLLCTEEAVQTTPKTTAHNTVAVFPGGEPLPDELALLERKGVVLLATNDLENQAPARKLGIEVLVPSNEPSIIETQLGLIGSLSGEQFRHFDQARLLALRGAEILFVFDCHDDMNLIRSRAIENQLFILALGLEFGAIVTPKGAVLGYASRPDREGLVVDINVSEAADKRVAPQTDIWEQRRVRAYR